MISRRTNWLFRLSIVLNIVVLCYVATQHMVSYEIIPLSPPGSASGASGPAAVANELIQMGGDDLQTPGRNLASVEYGNANGVGAGDNGSPLPSNPTLQDANLGVAIEKTVLPTSNRNIEESGADALLDSVPSSLRVKSTTTPQTSSFSLSNNNNNNNNNNNINSVGDGVSVPLALGGNTTPSVGAALGDPGFSFTVPNERADWCVDREVHPRTAQRGDYWVLYNYVRGARRFRCDESITYTTHADYTFLDNLEPLLERWQGPVSVALFAPGDDMVPTLATIRYLRACGSELISDLVTFHIYFNNHHVPKSIPRDLDDDVGGIEPVNCSRPAPWVGATTASLYKTQKHLLYPVNVGRNIAREAASTHYILPSDIELYPSPGVIPKFLAMVREAARTRANEQSRAGVVAPRVYPLAIFEVESGSPLPENKTQLVRMLRVGRAIPFHKKVCAGCHNVPRAKEWQSAPETTGLHVFHIGKRVGYYVHWEPIFIGTHDDPLYDERLSWEGKSDKMTQGYALCVLDYEFHILDNAFLVHKPGIKTVKKDTARAALAAKTNALIRKEILPQLKVLFGVRKGCAV